MAPDCMETPLAPLTPPMRCVLCGASEQFASREHIVPESLGNDLLVLAPGWVCDICNNTCSAFEARVLGRSILGVERCRLGVLTKKQKPARASLYGIEWFSEPTQPKNTLAVEADWSRVPMLLKPDGKLTMALPLHDESNIDVCRLLLKIGVELFSIMARASGQDIDLDQARAFVLGRSLAPWPYFVLRGAGPPTQVVSVLNVAPSEHEYIKSCGFDLFLHQIDQDVVVMFQFGHFVGASCITSRDTKWIQVLRDWGTPFVGCPIEFAGLNG